MRSVELLVKFWFFLFLLRQIFQRFLLYIGFDMDYFGYSTNSVSCYFTEKSPFWLLGKEISFQTEGDSDDLKMKLRSLMWMSYRSGFESIGGFTTDAGWGCMYRSAQMMMGNVLLRRNKKEEEEESSSSSTNFSLTARLFLDEQEAPYSLHSLVPIAESSLGRKSGEWIAPSEALQVLSQKMKLDEKGSHHPSIYLHIARDGVLYIDEFLMESQKVGNGSFSPSIISVPARLGLEQLNEVYVQSVKDFFQLSQNVGIIGGQPRSSYYFIGCQDDTLFYLDPHTVQAAVTKETLQDSHQSYFPTFVGSISIQSIDPSMALCFYCESEESFRQLAEKISQSKSLSTFFSIEKEKPNYHGQSAMCDEWEMEDFKHKSEIVSFGEEDEFVLM